MKGLKYIPVLFIFLAMTACKQKSDSKTTDTTAETPDTSESKAIPAEQLITPGEGIGHIRIGEGLDSIIAVLGKPDTGDAAMGSSLATWYAGHDTAGYKTSVFAHHNMGGKDENIAHAKKILVTSPWFKTAEYISTGNTLADIQKYYTVKKGSNYKNNGQTIDTYTDLAKGISFEINPSGKCVSILVHRPNEEADTYLNMH